MLETELESELLEDAVDNTPLGNTRTALGTVEDDDVCFVSFLLLLLLPQCLFFAASFAPGCTGQNHDVKKVLKRA